MLKGIEIIKDRLQRKRKQYIHQGEKIEQMKWTMQKTSEEIEQLEYVLSEMEHISDTHREPRVIPNDKVGDVFAYLCRVFEFLQHRLRSHTPGREYLSFATILTYFKRERGMTDGWFQKYRNIEIITWKTNVLGTEMTNLIFFPYFCVSIFEWYDTDNTIKRKRQTLISAFSADGDGSRSDTRKQ